MRAIIHVGLPKTGTSAIQNYFAANEFPGFEYARFNSPNHSGLMLLLFGDIEYLREHHGFKPRGEEFFESVPALRRQLQDDLDAQLERLSESETTLVISAEFLSNQRASAVRNRLRDYISRHASDMRVIGYVRPPRAWAGSTFQQGLKTLAVTDFPLQPVWPHYRKRFEEIERDFGRENVIIRPYRRDLLHRGDAISDFGQVLGLDIPVPPGGRQADNESLSAEATALLFVHRTLGSGFESGHKWALRAQRAFIERLRSIGRQRFTFADSVWQPLVERHADDLAWVRERLGHDLDDSPAEGDAIRFGSDQDLIDLALSQAEALEDLIGGPVAAAGEDRLKRVLLGLEALKEEAAMPWKRADAKRPARSGAMAGLAS